MKASKIWKGSGKKVKRIFNIIMIAAMVLSSLSLPQNAQKAYAQDTATITVPSANTFITNEAGKGFQAADFNSTYCLDGEKNEDGTLRAIEQIVLFGKDYNKGYQALSWYIAGKNADGTLVLMCNPAQPLESTSTFLDSVNCSGGFNASRNFEGKLVYANHYGASNLEYDLSVYASGTTSAFTSAEQALMANTNIYTKSISDDQVYALTDKLYAPYGESKNTYITVGNNSKDSLNSGLKISLVSGKIATESKATFWLRTPDRLNEILVLCATMGKLVSSARCSMTNRVVPAMHLKLSSVLFASSATAATSDAALGITEEGVFTPNAMIFRMDSAKDANGKAYKVNGVVSDRITSSASASSNRITVDNPTANEFLYIQWNEAGTDKVKAFQPTAQKNAYTSLDGIPADLTNCRIWIEKKDTTDNIVYAKSAHVHSFTDGICSDENCEMCEYLANEGNHNFKDDYGNDIGYCKVCYICKSVAKQGSHTNTCYVYKNTQKHAFACAECGIYLSAYWDNHVFTNGRCNCGFSEIALLTNNTYVEKNDLALVFGLYGENAKLGKVNFGNNKTWYIAGAQNNETELVLLCDPENPFESRKFSESVDNKNNNGSDWGIYKTALSDSFTVGANHYGASDIRAYLNGLCGAGKTDLFTTSEQALIKNTRVYTKDVYNENNVYFTSDKLFLPFADLGYGGWFTVGANSENDLNSGIKVAIQAQEGPDGSPYTQNGDDNKYIWLRTASSGNNAVLAAKKGDSVVSTIVTKSSNISVLPAFNMDLSSVLFASVATASSSDATLGVTDQGTFTSNALTFRMDGTDIVESKASVCTGNIQVTKGNNSDEYLYIQGNDGTQNWVYSKLIDASQKVTLADIEANTGLSDVDLTNCEIWIEKTQDNITYAKVIVNKLGHSKDLGTRVEPTCETKGSITYKCSNCGDIVEIVDINALGHKWDKGTVTKEATVEAEGVKTYRCTNNGCSKTKTESIPKLKKNTPKVGDIVNDDNTGAKVKILDSDKKEVAYMASGSKKAKEIKIPDKVLVKGITYKVIKIDDKAFKSNKVVTKITLPSSIKTIGKEAFYGCSKLKTITLSKNLTEIGANAFKGCSSLTQITLQNKTTKIGANAFNGCKKLKTITIKATKLTTKTVAKGAFNGLLKSTVIKVPKKQLKTYQKLFKSKGFKGTVKA